MILDSLIRIVEEKPSLRGRMYLRTLLKEALQDYVLEFVYNHREYKKLLFTGGTCLRKIYGLPRLSEDLDFDYTDQFSIETFNEEVINYFAKKFQYRDIESKISRNQQTVYLKFPVLDQLGLVHNRADSTVLFLRCDFSSEKYSIFSTEIHSLSTKDFSFFVISYNLATLFANKIVAFIEREYYRGGQQTIPFKGRDIFDLVWFLERNKKSSLQPNWERLQVALQTEDKSEIVRQVISRLEGIHPKQVREDLSAFIESTSTLEDFVNYYPDLIAQGMKCLVD